MRLALFFCAVVVIAAAETGVTQIAGKVVAGTSVHFKTEKGAVYDLIRNTHSAALFLDTNLYSRTLLLKGREQPGGKFEVTGNLHSLKEGKIYELFYYCPICVIETSVGGPCLCCREDLILTERLKSGL